MLAKSGDLGRSKPHLLQRRNSLARGCAVFALFGASLWPGLARAEDEAQPGDPALASSRQEAAPRRIELLARGSYADLRWGLMSVGIEGTYFTSPRVGVGGAIEALRVDHAVPHWEPPGTLSNGIHALLSVEAKAFDYWLTPYARASAGVGAYNRIRDFEPQLGADFVGQLQFGIALRAGPIVGKLNVAPTLYGPHPVLAYSVGLGARF